MIAVTDATWQYATSEVSTLSDIDLAIESGELVVLCGASGSGKSTLLRMMNGLIPHFHEGALSGRISVADLDVRESALEEIGRRTGTVLQHPRRQFFTSTVIDELSFALENFGTEPADIQARVETLMRRFMLNGIMERPLLQLSGGQQQRVGIARALADEPAVLLCDEPTSALDPETTRSILDLIRDVRDRLGVTVVIITHEMSVVRRICDSVSLLEAGRIVQSGPIEDVVSDVGSRLSRELVPPPDVPGAVRAGSAESAGGATGAVNVVIDVALTAHPGEPAAAQVLALVAEQGADVAGGVFETLGTAQVGRLALTIPADRARAAVEALHDAGITAEVRA